MNSEQKNIQENNEITIIELIQKIQSIVRFLWIKWLLILFAGLLGGTIGLAYAFFQPVRYISKISFVVEENKGGAGGLASLAGQFGFDLGGASGAGVFSGDNVLLFLKSESLCRETLFSSYDSTGKTLADRYAEVTKLKENWEKEIKIGTVAFSNFLDQTLPRKEDSLMQLIVSSILKNDLAVVKPDKKASFVEVKTTMQDELLSKLFSERLVKIATDGYVESKTRTKALNVAKLQRKADSLAALLNDKTYVAAALQQNLVDVNPALRTAPIVAEISSREKTMAATVFAEVVKNLEISKTMLSQETPVIQVVDQSSFPLEKERVGKLTSLLAGGFLVAFLVILFLLVRRWYQSLKVSMS